MMDEVQKWEARLKAQETVELLNGYGFNAVYAPTKEDARRICMDMIPEGSSICVGGSVTLKQTGIMDEITSGGEHRINPWYLKFIMFSVRYLAPVVIAVIMVRSLI